MVFERTGLDASARTPLVLQTGKYAGVSIAAIDIDDLRAVVHSPLGRDADVRRAVADEIGRRHGRRGAHRHERGGRRF
jgi:hypothetical protein